MRILDYLNFIKYIKLRRYERPIEKSTSIAADKKEEKKDN